MESLKNDFVCRRANRVMNCGHNNLQRQAVVVTSATEIVGLFLKRIDDFDAINIRAVVHVFREQLAHTRIDTGSQ